MKRYRKKPVVIEAQQWPIKGGHPMVQQFSQHGKAEDCKSCGAHYTNHGYIRTLEGNHIVCPGDWIIKGIAGEIYPCKPTIFERLYEDVTEEKA